MQITLRPATPDDAPAMAPMVDIAGHGLPMILWAALAENGQTPLDVGIARAASDVGPFSWRNATIAEIDGQIAGMISSYETGPTPIVVDPATPAIPRPLIALVNTVPLTRYINVLMTVDRFRRMGVACRLMAHAETIPGPNGMSLIAADSNTGGRAFYRGLGYVEGARKPVVRDGWTTDTRDWILLTKRP